VRCALRGGLFPSYSSPEGTSRKKKGGAFREKKEKLMAMGGEKQEKREGPLLPLAAAREGEREVFLFCEGVP